ADTLSPVTAMSFPVGRSRSKFLRLLCLTPRNRMKALSERFAISETGNVVVNAGVSTMRHLLLTFGPQIDALNFTWRLLAAILFVRFPADRIMPTGPHHSSEG